MPPYPLTTNAQSETRSVTVIAKMAPPWVPDDLAHLKHEAVLHDAMSTDECLGLHRGVRHAGGEEDGDPGAEQAAYDPVVPKFYGYCVPPAAGQHERRLSPILLTEDCGKPIRVEELVATSR